MRKQYVSSDVTTNLVSLAMLRVLIGDVRVAVEGGQRERVLHPQHVDVGEEHRAARREELVQDGELEPRRRVVVGRA